MKKYLTLLLALTAAFIVNAESLSWSVKDNMTGFESNADLCDQEIKLNDYVSFVFTKGEATQSTIYRYSSSSDTEPTIVTYANSVLTFKATEMNIKSIKFIVAPTEVTNQSRPDWKINGDNGETYTAANPQWTGEAAEISFTIGNKFAFSGFEVEYDLPSLEKSVTWAPSSIGATNNDEFPSNTFKINDNLQITFETGSATAPPKYRKVTTLTNPIVMIYKGNLVTITATDAEITSVKFLIATDGETSDHTPTWGMNQDSSVFNAENDTWTGYNSEIIFTGAVKTAIEGFTIEYTIDEGQGDGDDDDDPQQPVDPEEPGDFQKASLFFFTEEQSVTGAEAQNVTLSDNGTTVVFTSNSESATLDSSKAYFGTADEYTTLTYRYRPGGKSSNGINSTNKGVFTFPCDGILYIYAFNNQTDSRSALIVQDGETVLNHVYSANDYVSPEGSSAKVYPVISRVVKKGTAYFLWPDNQLMLYGFEFEPITIDNTSGSLYMHETEADGTFKNTLPYEFTKTTQNGVTSYYLHTIYLPTDTYFVLSDAKFADDADDFSWNALGDDATIYYMTTDETLSAYEVSQEPTTQKIVAVKASEVDEITPFLYNAGPRSISVTLDENGEPANLNTVYNSTTGVEDVIVEDYVGNGIRYNIFGQSVDESYRGIVIMNGKKFIQR